MTYHGKYYLAIVATLSLLFSLASQASSINRVSFSKVAQDAELVFQGTVLSKETRLIGPSRTPFTYFTFQITDVIKGNYASDKIELGYMGGPKGKQTLNVSDMVMPQTDEEGIYFVESLSQKQVHPLLGWQQGHYRVVEDPQSGEKRVSPLVSSPANALSITPSVQDFKQSILNTLNAGGAR